MAKLSKKTTAGKSKSSRSEETRSRSSSRKSSGDRTSKTSSSRSSSRRGEDRRSGGNSRSSRSSGNDRRGRRQAPPQSNSMPLILGGVAAIVLLGIGAFFAFGGKEEKPKEKAPVKPVVLNEKPKKSSKKGISESKMKEIYKSIGRDFFSMKETWEKEAEAKYPKPAGVDQYNDRARKSKVNSYINSMESSYKAKKAREFKIRSADIAESLRLGDLHDWPQ